MEWWVPIKTSCNMKNTKVRSISGGLRNSHYLKNKLAKIYESSWKKKKKSYSITSINETKVRSWSTACHRYLIYRRKRNPLIILPQPEGTALLVTLLTITLTYLMGQLKLTGLDVQVR